MGGCVRKTGGLSTGTSTNNNIVVAIMAILIVISEVVSCFSHPLSMNAVPFRLLLFL